MNQTKKRLKIIKLAISITDMETIQLQVLKLSALKTDAKIQEIIAGLQAENYAQTQALITTYIEMPMEEILQRTSQESRQVIQEKDRAIIEEFDLFVTTPENKEEEKKEFFDFNTLASEDVQKKEQETIDFDALLNIETDDILAGNIELDISHTPKDTFFDLPVTEKTKESHINTAFIPKDTFFDIEKPPVIQEVQKEKVVQKEETTVLSEEHNKETTQEEPSTIPSEENIPSQYRAIPYIDQKFKNMHTQYPPVQESDENFSSVNAWLLQISNDGYTNDEVEEMIRYITKLTKENSLAEAAQLLLISGATKSKFAQFMLARALYTGKILQKNLPESFTLINRLAMDDDYPEAICDLAQFYENGIGIDKDKKKAEELYKEAMGLGIKRAIDHYERVKQQNSSFFSSFKK